MCLWGQCCLHTVLSNELIKWVVKLDQCQVGQSTDSDNKVGALSKVVICCQRKIVETSILTNQQILDIIFYIRRRDMQDQVRCANPECNQYIIKKRANHAFCSKRCNSAYRRVNWGWLRQMCLEQCNYQCVECEATERLECHHIRPICWGGRNELSNLVILCKCHHLEVHRNWAKQQKWLTIAVSEKEMQSAA